MPAYLNSAAAVMLPALPAVLTAGLLTKILLFAVAKKLTVIAAARLYGFPRLYRHSQHTVRQELCDWCCSAVRLCSCALTCCTLQIPLQEA